MAVIAEWIEKEAGGEEIEAVIVGPHDDDWGDRDVFNQVKVNTVLTWEEAKPFLLYEFSNGYGGADCHPFVAFTATKIITIHEYDGSTAAVWYPRHPVDVKVGFWGAEK